MPDTPATRRNLHNSGAYILAVATFVAFAIFVVLRQRQAFDIAALLPYRQDIMRGFMRTIRVSLVSLVGSMSLGFVLYLFTRSRVRYFRAFTDVFTEIIYGTPLLVMIMIMAFVIGPAFGSTNRAMMGFLGLTLYISPYMTNIYKSAIASIDPEQYMAMDLFGFSVYQRYRYIIIPQIVRILMPPLMNNFSLIIKGSALLSVLSYRELFYEVQLMTNNNFRFVEGFILMWLLYLTLTIPLSQITKWIDRRWGI
ncbi:amino acid ABC transporter permease [Spirochaeta africana]|uniref:Amine acid ABC transporter, permease protein, 3-TM region, His/Glu/Gln/Arg/opine family n=1 Tax=Spirochaeta africana (strain ATCC 700263 / DSM 8902 / Z-7692) TaxID=889378 RepID=H9UHE7_SPIAZ|nr:amino acid ABC transporter permease [Spirochaeta africana]AFG36940.1 amine acid ABC transporter, permease protein, 3-TM region, His/Glu/Gln/Arg/opine family [Spirochaeta africana DSM 8902]